MTEKTGLMELSCRECGKKSGAPMVAWEWNKELTWICPGCAWEEFITHAQEQGEDWCNICCEWFYIGDECSCGGCT